MGEEFVVIVTPTDHMCKKCTSLLTHMDKLENDLKLVKNAMLSYIQKKYGILPPDQAVKGVEIVNGHLKAEEQLEQGQRKVPSGLTVGVSPTVTPAAVVTPVQTPLKLLKTQQQQQQHQPQQHQSQQQHHHQQQPPPQQESTNKMKIYKCGFCTFQSKELGHVRFHMRTHMNKKEPEKPILNQAAAKTLTPVPQQKKRLYRCQVCSKSFDSRINCLDHIQKDHNQPTPSTSNGERETEDSRPVATKVIKSEPSKAQDNNEQAETPMDVDENQQDNNKGTVDTDMMLNDNVPVEGSADVDEQVEEPENAGGGEETENSQEDTSPKDAKSKKKSEPAQEEAAEVEEDEEDTAVPEQEEADQETPDSVEKEVNEDANVENKTGDLDIESMLAAIHNDNPPTNSGDSQSKA